MQKCYNFRKMSFASPKEAQSNTGFCSLKGGTKGLDSHGISDTACCRVREGRDSCRQHTSGGCSRSLDVHAPHLPKSLF